MSVTLKTGNLKYKNSQGQYVGIGAVGSGDITETVENWMNMNLTNPDSPPLDRTLSFSSSAAPADLVGDLKNAIEYYLTLASAYKTSIPENADLNDYTTPGNYKVTTAGIAQSLTNAPSDVAGSLYVFFKQ